jgi:hypothetical protein
MFIIDRKLIRGGNYIVARPLDERNVVLKFSIMNGVYILVLVHIVRREGTHFQRPSVDQLQAAHVLVDRSMTVPDYTVHNIHRWARCLKQQTSFTVYRLPTKENKLPFSFSIYMY